jgi:small subunit ribosomal protein S18
MSNSDYEKKGKSNEDRVSDDEKEGMHDKKKIYLKRKVCRFCLDNTLIIDYKNDSLLRRFTTEGGKIIPRRMSGNCAKHQRYLSAEIKRARFISLLPYTKN